MTNIEVVFEPRDQIVSMVEHRGEVYLATQRRVYRMLRDDFTGTVRFLPVVFHEPADSAQSSAHR